jgi:hypothetical protein
MLALAGGDSAEAATLGLGLIDGLTSLAQPTRATEKPRSIAAIRIW